jgi:transposase
MGQSRGGLTTKIHALVDAEGRPVPIELTAGQAGDAPTATKLLETGATGATVLADKAYDTDGIRTFAAARGGLANIPQRITRTGTFAFRRWVYRQRNAVAGFFNKIKDFRAIFT